MRSTRIRATGCATQWSVVSWSIVQNGSESSVEGGAASQCHFNYNVSGLLCVQLGFHRSRILSTEVGEGSQPSVCYSRSHQSEVHKNLQCLQNSLIKSSMKATLFFGLISVPSFHTKQTLHSKKTLDNQVQRKSTV